MSKATFAANTFAAKTFACGTLRGVGVISPTQPIGGAGRTTGGDAGKPVFSERDRELNRRRREREREEERRKRLQPPKPAGPPKRREREPVHRTYLGAIQLPSLSVGAGSEPVLVAVWREPKITVNIGDMTARHEATMALVAFRFEYKSDPIILHDSSSAIDPVARRTYHYESSGDGVVRRKKPMDKRMLALVDPDLARVVKHG